ncbi:MAG: EAL domain-containing protein [Alphaproteobacteria bacterium]|nr:MAG: EAL domain-containing protein [Alphaproteobacteria bacterium]
MKWLLAPVGDELAGEIRRTSARLLTWRDGRWLGIAGSIAAMGVFGSPAAFLLFSLFISLAALFDLANLRAATRAGPAIPRALALRIGAGNALLFAAMASLPLWLLGPGFSQTLLVAGCLWTSTALAFVGLNYGGSRVHSYPGFAVAAALLIAYLELAGQTPLAPAGPWHGMALTVLVAMCIGVLTAQFLYQQRATAHLIRAREAEAEQRRQFESRARYDALTGLLNRAEFERLLGEAIAECGRRDPRFTLLMLDLDGFKAINDVYGHAAGDAVLVAVGKRLRANLRATDLVARLGGDEFAVLLTSLTDRAEATATAERLCATIRARIPWEKETLAVGVSIGIAMQGEVGAGPAELIAAADRAMYLAKAERGCGWRIWESGMNAAGPTAEQGAALEAAIRHGQIVPFYQPKIELASGRIAGFEALARWEQPGGRIAMPSEFLPVAEEFGLTRDLTFAMVGCVLRDIRDWRAAGLDPGVISVNVDETLLCTTSGLDELEWRLAEVPEAAGHFGIEVTEGVTVGRSAVKVRENLERLSESGVRVAMDDFGTGFASFQHLRSFAFHEFKVDGSFVAGLGSDPRADAIVDAFLAMATGLGADVVAESVETAEQARILAQRGCRYGQGFLFGAPAAAEAVRERLARSGAAIDAGNSAA